MPIPVEATINITKMTLEEVAEANQEVEEAAEKVI